MMDTTTRLGNSMVQHGPFSNRIYLMKLDPRDLPAITEGLDDLCRGNGYTKIFAKVPRAHAAPFLQAGYVREATVPGFFEGKEDGDFLSRFVDPRRADPGDHGPEIRRVLELAEAKAGADTKPPARTGEETLFACAPAHAEEMSLLYREVFATYPFPIHDPAYLRETMASHVAYFGARATDGRLAALASSEMDEASGNVEMTDFATLPQMRGRGLAQRLLALMEREMRRRGLVTAYTIARALSAGMNITFSRRGYRFGGTLVNNTQISGRIESMNIWYKPLA
jgi:putative beta-lysine N-acetyltransferase